MALAITRARLERSPTLAITAAVMGALAGLTQAIGLWRWVFVVPSLAREHSASGASQQTRVAAEQAFVLLNQYGGVVIGEHIGQLLTAMFVGLVSRLQWIEGQRLTPLVGYGTAAAIAVGTNEGVAISLDYSGELFGLITIAGFLGLTAWLLLTGAASFRSVRAP